MKKLLILVCLFAVNAHSQVEVSSCRELVTTTAEVSKMKITGKVQDCQENPSQPGFCLPGSSFTITSINHQFIYNQHRTYLFIVSDGKGGVLKHLEEVVKRVDSDALTLRLKGNFEAKDFQKMLPKFQSSIDSFINPSDLCPPR